MPEANADWNGNLTIGGRELEVVYRGNSPFELYKSITNDN